MIRKLRFDRRVQILIALMLFVMASFWLTSRYPSLDAKSMMAGSSSLADGLSFDAWIPHGLDDSTLRQVVVTYLNWLHTNLQGMVFGLLIAILIVTLVPLIRDELDLLLTRRFSATLAGAILGAPLGVCVNCAAPIGYGMYKQGARLEAALATMISSPTMNIVVLSMAFAIFPSYLVAIKVIASLISILVVVPLVVGLFPGEAMTAEPLDSVDDPPLAGSLAAEDVYLERRLLPALEWLGRTLAKQTWVIFKQIVPLMLLAGFMGAAAVVLAPWDELVNYLPHGISARSLGIMLLLSAFGLFLPVPIAFDIILCSLLLASGVPVQYVAILLFVLGVFSVYSFLVILKARATQVAWALSLALVLIGFAVGLTSKLAQDLHNQNTQSPLFEELMAKQDAPGAGAGRSPERQAASTRAQNRQRPASRKKQPVPQLAWQDIGSDGRVSRLALTRQEGNLDRFTRIVPADIGLGHHLKRLVLNLTHDTPDSNGISGGDFNNDGWFDLLFSTSDGVVVYKNVGGSFELHARLAGDNPQQSLAGAAAFADLDNDGQPDVLFSEDASGLWVAYNDSGTFLAPVKLPETDQHFAKALAFLDINRDSLLDFVVGNVSHVMSKRPSTELARNFVYQSEGGRYVRRALPEPLGETLSILLTDADANGDVDLFVGNDFDEPDVYLYFDESNEIQSLPNDRFELSTQTTMSIDAADIDNDLEMEIFVAQATSNPTSGEMRIQQAKDVTEKRCQDAPGPYCDLTRALAVARRAQKKDDATLCETLEGSYRVDCIAGVYFSSLRKAMGPRADKEDIHQKSLILKGDYPTLYQRLNELNQVELLSEREIAAKFLEFVPQQRKANIFLKRNQQGVYRDLAKARGVDIAGWAWNARFADLDADAWQDLYVVNGWTPVEWETTNVLFHNQQGEKFVIRTEPFGLIDFEPTIAYTYIDYDNDGDLDIISYGMTGRTAVFRNDFHANHSIQFELRDWLGNHFGVGSTLVIRYGAQNAKHQIREIKLNGGHLSFDPLIAHFGIAEETSVQSVEVRWSTGEKETFSGPFESGHRYRLKRQRASAQAASTSPGA